MKNITLSLFALFFSISFNAQTFVATNNTSGPNSCDGSAYLTDSLQNGSWEWYNNDELIQQGGQVIYNLCPGTYMIVITSNGTSMVETFTISVGNGNDCSTFYAYFTTIIHPTGVNTYDGIIEAQGAGGTAPYNYVWSNGVVSNMLVYLSSGFYSVNVSDANGCNTQLEIVLFVDSTNQLCDDFFTTVTTNPNSSLNPNGCNGSAIITPYGGLAPYSYESNNLLLSSGLIENLCVGAYYVLTTDANGCVFHSQFYIENSIDTLQNNQLYAFAFTTNVSEADVCDGSVYIDVYGGIAPYSFVDVDGQLTNQFIDGLCEGIYTTIVSDNSGQIFTLNYFVASPNNIIDNGGNYGDTLIIIDTLYSNFLENCIIDYLSIDTAYVSNIEFITMDSIVVTWLINDANGVTEINNSYNISGFGFYEIILQVFCPTRAENKFLVVKQKILLNGTQLFVTNVNKSSIIIYPNPVAEQLTIKSNSSKNFVVIHDVLGKIVYETKENNSNFNIDFTTFSKGQYIITVSNDIETIRDVIIK
jgi:hypothetical protein